MDNKAYENNMFDFVNRNCERAEQARMNAFAAEEKKKLEAYLAAEQEEKAKRICMKRNALVKIFIWVEVFVCALLYMFFLNFQGIAHPVLQVVISGVVGLVAGLRINALARAFRK